MSRFSAKTKNNLKIVIGYDRPLSEYFVQVFDKDGELVQELTSYGRSCVKNHEPLSNGKMLGIIKDLLCEEDLARLEPQLNCLAMDMPF